MARTPLEMGGRLGLAVPLRLLRDHALDIDPVFLAARHRRQYADEPGSRVACRAGLVRPSAISAESALRRQHPLVAAGRSADRGHHPRASADLRRRGRGEGRDRDSAIAAASSSVLLLGADSPATDRQAGLSSGVRDLVLRRIRHRNVHAGPYRSPRLAARLTGSGRGRNRRSQTSTRRRGDRHCVGNFAVDRAGNDHLHRDHAAQRWRYSG